MAIFTWLFSLLGPNILGSVNDAYKAHLQANNTAEKLDADIVARAIDVKKREDEVSATVLTAEQGNLLTRMIRPLFALPFIVYIWKVVVYDKVFGFWTQGATDTLSPALQDTFKTILTAYFLGKSAEIVTSVIANRMRR